MGAIYDAHYEKLMNISIEQESFTLELLDLPQVGANVFIEEWPFDDKATKDVSSMKIIVGWTYTPY